MSPNGAEPETITPVIDPPKKKRTKRTPKGNAFLNPLAAALLKESEYSITDAVVICTESDYDSVTIDQVDNIKALLRDDHRFIVFLQGATDRVKLMPVEKKPDMFDRIDADMAAAGEAETKAAEGDTRPAESDTIPTIGETLAANADTVVQEPDKVMETIARPMTNEERAQFELKCHMAHCKRMAALGAIYNGLKNEQADLQSQISDVHKQLKDTAKKLAELATTAVDMTFQDPIPFEKPPVEGSEEDDNDNAPEQRDEHGELIIQEAAPAARTINTSNPDLSHIDNPGSGKTIDPPADDDSVPE